MTFVRVSLSAIGVASVLMGLVWVGQGRARIEQAVGKLKRFKRIAPRCEKTERNYGSFVALALGFILIKSVHTA